MRRKITIGLLVALLSAGAYWGYARYGKKQPEGLQASGTIEATKVQLCARVSGTLQNIALNAGDPVQKGQLVAVVVRNDLIAQKERDALGVLKAEAQLADLTSGARWQEIKDAEIAVNTARTNYDKADKDYGRALALFQASAISQSEMDNAETALQQAKNQVESAESKLSLLKAGNRPEQIEAARAELERSNAILKASEAALEDTRVLSPVDGVILTKNFEEGEFIQAGASVATAVNLDDMWIKIYLPTDDLPKIKLGQQVAFTVSGSEAKYGGIIEEIATSGEYTPKTIQTKKERTNIVYEVRIKINNENGILKPGMPADVIIDEAR
ncbi:HlyD family efflux transporter periplasmic adaptor subunit [Pelotomaculum terephthalicicum JT]|uniref:HlyD family secretion protein n=1 Tax=Pelotomaculum TaxID=191373 RepID=UPI0009C6077D|nr:MULTISPECIES: HlyD family efflux transporter periplasmic adaptor subunit [Pelotomaculum]MCG9966501.1 HlyD family efflux transporter periplasmic adaptor subunit [Pelotomaculum terephthalicicum JT]OPX85999.1 MAG: Macrolide export protein MacA [Pelotomaculum sp. PtaB.Bin117]OPY60685.1 MAG: Macrolide export protein MacA [Pelotomaculum sp. PtaU1.Bin065]